MKLRTIGAILVFVGVFVLHTHIAFAHFPATDKTMLVILHVDPDDQPVAEQPSKLNFIYDDQLGKFNNQKCDCRVTISEQGQRLYSAPAIASNGNSSYGNSLPYTFRKPDVYTISLSGVPKEDGNFVPFKVSWEIRVTPNPDASPNDEKYYIIGFFFIVVLGVGSIGYFIYRDFRGV